MKYRVGIDLGGTSAKIAVVNEKRKIVRVGSVSTVGRPNPKRLAKSLANVCRGLMKGFRVNQVGVGVAGDIDFVKGIVRVSPNLGWKNVPLGQLLARSLRKRVVVDNDANVAAWGIYNTQAPKSTKNAIVVTLGTGVGGGIILNRELYHGATGTAGEIGHMTMTESGRRCNCGNVGCLEIYAGGFYLKNYVRRALERGQSSRLRTLFNQDPDQISPYSVAQAANAGDRFAIRVWDEVGHKLGVALGNLIYVFNPEIIFLTGGVAQARHLILDPLWETLRKRAFTVPINAVKIKIAKEAAHVGVIGASLL